jgi:hypothetical protein
MPDALFEHSSVTQVLRRKLADSINLVAFPHSFVDLATFVLHFTVSMHHVLLDHSLILASVLEQNDANLVQTQLVFLELELTDHFNWARIETNESANFLILAARVDFLDSQCFGS